MRLILVHKILLKAAYVAYCFFLILLVLAFINAVLVFPQDTGFKTLPVKYLGYLVVFVFFGKKAHKKVAKHISSRTNWIVSGISLLLVSLAVFVSVSLVQRITDIRWSLGFLQAYESGQVTGSASLKEKFGEPSFILYPKRSKDLYKYHYVDEVWHYCRNSNEPISCFKFDIDSNVITGVEPGWGAHEFSFIKYHLFMMWVDSERFGLNPNYRYYPASF